MNTLRSYVEWKLTHSQKKPEPVASRNLFDKGNIMVQNAYYTVNPSSTESGVAFYTSNNCTTTTYAQIALIIGNASDFKGKTITFSTPSYGGTVATKINVMKANAGIQNGSNSTKVGNVYCSRITVENKEYTDEKLCIILYAYGKGASELVTYDEIMVNEGSEILPYEPYRK